MKKTDFSNPLSFIPHFFINQKPCGYRVPVIYVFTSDFTEHDFETTGSKRAQQEQRKYTYAVAQGRSDRHHTPSINT